MTLIRTLDPRGQTHWKVDAPAATHHDIISCRDADCADFLAGFVIDCLTDDAMGQARAGYIRHQMNEGEPPARRRYFKESVPMPGVARFWFPPGTRCFRQHRGIVREGIFSVTPGAASPSVLRPLVWRDDMNEELWKLKDLRKREGYE